MARLSSGIGGPLHGKVGAIVGATWKGIPYVRSRPSKRTGKPGAGEQANRNKFSMAHRWLQPLLPFVREGFKGYSPTVEGFNAAKSYLLLHAFTNPDANPVIDPSLVQLSHGDLPLSTNITVEKGSGYRLLFSWDGHPVEDGDNADQVMLLAYDPEHEAATFTTTGQFRSSGSDILQLEKTRERTYHVYFAFTAHDRSRQSHSVYLGAITT